MDFTQYVRIAQAAERGKMDAIFFQDTVAVNGSAALDGVSRFRPKQGRQAYLEPTTLLAALATVTSRIGLIATATTTYNEPYNIARRFAWIDHISGGRAGWNLVTSQIEDEAGNFGADHHMQHALRYERAEEFYDVMAGLWDSFEDGALIRDKSSGDYIDPAKLHFLDHRGRHFAVRGPLNMALPAGATGGVPGRLLRRGNGARRRTADRVSPRRATSPKRGASTRTSRPAPCGMAAAPRM
jgi:alkanesulfonate monooxygenase SsuD/methylene tetrahydromethanopterin reductase-like flavin-dependent oxidoreductase (luciferase family)